MALQISVIGAGGWGTTLGNLLAKKGYLVKIWSYEKETIESINVISSLSVFSIHLMSFI